MQKKLHGTEKLQKYLLSCSHKNSMFIIICIINLFHVCDEQSSFIFQFLKYYFYEKTQKHSREEQIIIEKFYLFLFQGTMGSREIERVACNGKLDYNRGIIPVDDTLFLFSWIIANGVLLYR